MLKHSGSIVCPSCGRLVGVNDEQCLNCGRRYPGMWGLAPLLSRFGRDLGFDQFVVGACVLLFAATIVADFRGLRMSGLLSFLSPSTASLFLFGASGAIPVFQFGRWWTFLSAGWLHGGILHIFFNMMWIRQLAPATSEFYGASRMVIIYTFSGVTGFAASSLAGAFLTFLPEFLRGAGFTIGASASIFGLLGALEYYGRRTGSRILSEQVRSWALFAFVFGFLVRGIDNWAHLGGFIGGYAMGRFLDPLYPERLDHLVIALACLALSAVAIVASLLIGLPQR